QDSEIARLDVRGRRRAPGGQAARRDDNHPTGHPTGRATNNPIFLPADRPRSAHPDAPPARQAGVDSRRGGRRPDESGAQTPTPFATRRGVPDRERRRRGRKEGYSSSLSPFLSLPGRPNVGASILPLNSSPASSLYAFFWSSVSLETNLAAASLFS